jgi:hypothetical protein
MKTLHLTTLLLTLATPAFADRACYSPHAITDCRAHWSGSRGGGQGIAENCHKLPPCPQVRQ